ncbi:MAG: DUF4040 domain-containing protein, partial [Alphaproteobacteria bacterium]|nr:DUF4040 domain-containing protein [Alphaproteobacteria bacterium]
MNAGSLVDIPLAGMMVWLAWRAQAGPAPIGAALCFIVLGLLTILAWLRLGAPDVAIAEAAVGTGLTGVLLLEALAAPRPERPGRSTGVPAARRLLAVAALAGGAVLVAVLLRLPETSGLHAAVRERLPATGVSSPVTGVLLAFRAYDTLLEIGVLALAVAAGWGLAGEAPRPRPMSRDPVLDAFARRIVPLGVLVAGYLWWAGGSRPGGAFQAGTVLGVAWVILILTGLEEGPSPTRWHGRALVVGGFALFLAIGLAGPAMAGALLAFPSEWSVNLILLIEAALTISIAACLA